MTRNLMRAVALAALAAGLAACDGGRAEERQAERAEARYQKAMAEYKAGNLDKAVRELEDVLRATPGNLSARFLLASLQQERKDCVSAFCNFREFLLLAPEGDKADMARQRLALCEEQLGRAFAEKMNLTDNAAVVREGEELRQELAASRASCADLEAGLSRARKELAALTRENGRLRRMLGEVGAADSSEGPARVQTDRDILDDEDGAARAPRADAGRETPRDDGRPAPARNLDDVKKLLADADDDAGRVLRAPDAPADGKPPVKLTEMADTLSAHGRAKGRETPELPETYVVQEGETLNAIARRFYAGRRDWRWIQSANKATISNDGKVKAGQRIVIPKP